MNVIPRPQKFRFTGENFLIKNSSVHFEIYCNEDKPLSIAVSEIKEILKNIHNCKVDSKSISANKIILGIPEGNDRFRILCERLNILPEKNHGIESYKLLIDSSQIIISAVNTKGIFYGIQTLKQIVNSTETSYLPGVVISDWPSLKYRAVMDDISRGPVPTMDYIKYQIRRLAEIKVNMFMQYVEHVVKTKSHPEFAPADGSLTIEDLKDLSEYAARYNIKFVGNFQSFGHFDKILSTPEYAKLGESGTLLSPVNPDSYKFLSDIYSEMVPAFNAPFFFINCDETFDLGKGASKKLVDSLGYAEVYYMHIMKLYSILKKLNSGVMIWGDILLKYPELLKKIPKDIIVATWTYDDLDSYSKFIQPIKDAGLNYFVTTGVLNSGKLYPDYKQVFGNIAGFASAAENSGALGLINSVWDGGTALFSNDWYGVTYGAEKSWNPDSGKRNSFNHRYNSAIYGAGNNNYTDAIWKLNELAQLLPTNAMNDKVLFQKIIPDSGKSLRISLFDWKKVINITLDVSNLLKHSKLKYNKRDKKYLQFYGNLYSYLAGERFSLIEDSKLYSLADSLQKSEPGKARTALVKILKSINGLAENELKLKNDFESLWLNENRTYSLSEISDKYDFKIHNLDDLKSKLLEALKDFDSHLPLSRKSDVRLSVSKLSGKYFTEWLMIKPITVKDDKNIFKKDYIAACGGEVNAAPKVTDEFYYDTVKYRWQRIASEYEDIISLKEIFPDNKKNEVTYAFATIESDIDTTVTAYTGFAGGEEIFLNGNPVFEKDYSEKIIPDEYKFSVQLRKGKNNILIKVSKTNNDWMFSFRIAGNGVTNHKNRYRIISD